MQCFQKDKIINRMTYYKVFFLKKRVPGATDSEFVIYNL